MFIGSVKKSNVILQAWTELSSELLASWIKSMKIHVKWNGWVVVPPPYMEERHCEISQKRSDPEVG